MAQFIQYSSSDAGGPGLLTGAAGTLIAVLKACLVDGYLAHAAAGWSQPVATAGNIGSFKNASPANGGNGFGFVINDNGPNVTSTFKEAWITGWETVLGVGAPVGTGTGQFPTPAQLLTSGHVVWRKSASADGVTRAWTIFADSLTCYVFMSSGDIAGTYQYGFFGDVFSLKGNTDAFRCMIMGRTVENTSGGATTSNAAQNDWSDAMAQAGGTTPGTGVLLTATPGHFLARTAGGGGASVLANKFGDITRANLAGTYNTATGATVGAYPFAGIVQTPNSPDNAYHLSPMWIGESASGIVRGRMRGLYHVCHPTASFADGQTFNGAGDFAGKTFQIVLKGTSGGFLAVETSNTLETN